MAAPSSPIIRTRFNGFALRVLWQPVEGATDYRLYASPDSFDDVLADEASATGVALTDVLTSVAHGLSEDDSIVFTALTGGTGLVEDTIYYVLADNLTADDFQVALTKGGAAENFSSDLTDSTWHLVLPPARLLEAGIDAGLEGDDGWFQHTFVSVDSITYVVLTALNVDDEESDPSNETRVIDTGPGTSFGARSDPFGNDR